MEHKEYIQFVTKFPDPPPCIKCHEGQYKTCRDTGNECQIFDDYSSNLNRESTNKYYRQRYREYYKFIRAKKRAA